MVDNSLYLYVSLKINNYFYKKNTIFIKTRSQIDEWLDLHYFLKVMKIFGVHIYMPSLVDFKEEHLKINYVVSSLSL